MSSLILFSKLETTAASLDSDGKRKARELLEARLIQDNVEIEKEIDGLLDTGLGDDYIEVLKRYPPNINFRCSREELEKEDHWGMFRIIITVLYLQKTIESNWEESFKDLGNFEDSPIRKYADRLLCEISQYLSLTNLRAVTHYQDCH
jgi:hypothetical protein